MRTVIGNCHQVGRSSGFLQSIAAGSLVVALLFGSLLPRSVLRAADPTRELWDAVNVRDDRKMAAAIAAGADPNAIRENFTPLMLGAVGDRLHVVEALLAAGAKPNVQDASGRTALMIAVSTAPVRIVRRLLAAGADPNLRVKDASPCWRRSGSVTSTSCAP